MPIMGIGICFRLVTPPPYDDKDQMIYKPCLAALVIEERKGGEKTCLLPRVGAPVKPALRA